MAVGAGGWTPPPQNLPAGSQAENNQRMSSSGSVELINDTTQSLPPTQSQKLRQFRQEVAGVIEAPKTGTMVECDDQEETKEAYVSDSYQYNSDDVSSDEPFSECHNKTFKATKQFRTGPKTRRATK